MNNFSKVCAVLLVVGSLGASYFFYTTYQKNLSIFKETKEKIFSETDFTTTSTQTNKTQKNQKSNKSLGYSTLAQETILDSLPTKGIIPKWLSGKLLRNGPAQFELPNNNQFNHWFDGFAMVHRFTFKDGVVSYANKFLETSFRRKTLKKGKLPSGFNQEKQKSSWFSAIGKLFGKPPVYDNTNVNISIYGNNYVALTETPHTIAFETPSLKTLGKVVYDDKLDGHVATAHPLIDPETKESFNVLINYGNTSTYQIYKMSEGSMQRQLITSLSTSLPSYMHSFALTKNHIILILSPLKINPIDLMFSNKSFIDHFKWKPEYGTELIIFDRKTGKEIGCYKTEPFFFFHIANSYDDKNYIVIDVSAFPDHSVIYNTKLKNLRSNKSTNCPSTIKRIMIDLEKGNIKTKQLGEHTIELPRINDRYTCKHYSFIYGVDISDKTLVKLNTKNLHSETWQEEGCFTGEPVFVQKPGCKGEDEGIILSTVLDTNNHNSFLLILDAKNMKELGRVTVPHHIPFGFHGQFYAETSRI